MTVTRLACGVLFLAAAFQAAPAGADGALASYRQFHVIKHDLSEFQDHSAECTKRLGRGFRLADWNDIVAYNDGGGSLVAFADGLKMSVEGGDSLPGDIAAGYRISRDGNEIWTGRRHYFFARHNHRKPSYFGAHAHLDNYYLSLGSWYGTGGHMLCYGTGSGSDGALLFADDFASGNTGRWDVVERPAPGRLAVEGGVLKINATAGGNYSVGVRKDIGVDGAYGGYSLSFDWKAVTRETPWGLDGVRLYLYDRQDRRIGSLVAINSGQTRRGGDVLVHVCGQEDVANRRCNGIGKLAETFDWQRVSLDTAMIPGMNPDNVVRVEIHAWVYNDAGSGGEIHVDNFELRGENGGTGGGSAPDLVVESPRSTESSVAPRGTLRFAATVRNRGKSRSVATTLRYYRSSDSRVTTSDTPVGTDPIGALSPSATDRQSIGLRAPSTAGTYYYGACVDSVPGESDTGNNCSSGVAVKVEGGGSGPDLVVESPRSTESSVAPRGTLRFGATVRNQGKSWSGATTLRYYRSSDSRITTSDTPVGTDRIGALSPSATDRQSIGQRVPSTPGTYYYGACVDSVSGESDRGNNCSSGVAVKVEGDATGPDLVVESPRSTESSVAPRGTLRFGATVRNRGKSRSGATILRYYRSSDSRITTSDTRVGTDRIGALSPSATDRQSIGQRVPGAPGWYWYGACVEPVTGESDTGNNCSSGVRVWVGDEPPPSEKVEVRVSLFGGGTVEVVGRGDLNCPVERLCSGYFPANGSLTLRAVDAPGYALDGWLGCDSVSGADCEIELHSDRLVSAEFLSTQPLQLKDNVVSFDESRLDDIEQYDPQSGVMVLSAGATTNDIEVGSVLMSSVSDPERSFESAFLRRVTDLSQASGSSVQLKTTHATVEDLILAGSLALRRDLGASEVAAYELPAGLTPISHPASELTVRELPGGRRIFEVLGTDGQPRSVATPLSSTQANAEQTVTGSIDFELKHKVDDGLEVTGFIRLTAEPTFLLDVGFPGGFREFKGQVRIIASSGMKIKVSQDLFNREYKQTLKGLRIKFNKPPPTFGPVVIVPEIEVDLYLKVSLKAGFEPTFTLAAEATAGAHYLRGEGWSGIWDFERTFDVDVPSGIELRANAEAGALVWLNTRVYDLVGPKIGIGPFLGADVFTLEEPRGPCKWDYELYLGGQAQYGGELKVFKWGWEFERRFLEGRWTLPAGRDCPEGGATVPTPPERLRFPSTTAASIVVEWDPPRESDGDYAVTYEVVRSQDPGLGPDRIQRKVFAVAEPRLNDVSLFHGTEYCYRVRSVLKGEKSVSSGLDCETTHDLDVAPPGPPTGLVAEAKSSSVIGLRWGKSIDDSGVSHYVIVDVTKGTDAVAAFDIGRTDGLSYDVTGLNAETRYCFAVSAVDGAGNSSIFSERACASTRDDTDPGDGAPTVFDLSPGNLRAKGITRGANDHLYVLDEASYSPVSRIYAYTTRGDPVENFELVRTVNLFPSGVAYASGLFYVVEDGLYGGDRVSTYTAEGKPVSSANFPLTPSNEIPYGIAANGIDRVYVVDGDGRVYVYTTSGVFLYYFRLDPENANPWGITYGDGRLYVVNNPLGTGRGHKVYAYTGGGRREPWADFDLDPANTWPTGIAYLGRFFVVDTVDEKVYIYPKGLHLPQVGPW